MTEQTLRVATVQAAPAFLDMQAGVVKAIRLIEEAAANGARLVAFPECWIPGYPWWIWLGSPAWGMQFVRRYHENSMIAGGPECQALQAAAREHEIFVVMGYSERDGGSLYIAQLLMDQDGALVAARRKLKATHVERTVYGEGDGSDIRVHNTALGRVGALCCWEHLNPLIKYAMYAQNEQIHIASWPSFSLYEGAAYALGPQLNTAVSQVYAAEGQCFVLAASGVVSHDMVELLCDTPDKRALLKVGGGAAMALTSFDCSSIQTLCPEWRPLSDPRREAHGRFASNRQLPPKAAVLWSRTLVLLALSRSDWRKGRPVCHACRRIGNRRTRPGSATSEQRRRPSLSPMSVCSIRARAMPAESGRRF